MDDWDAVWNWVDATWANCAYDNGQTYHMFFRSVACIIADREGLEEVGSSDVWHLTLSAARYAKEKGVKTRSDLQHAVFDYIGV